MEFGMDVNEVLQRRIRGMAVRILACIEHTLQANLEGVGDNENFGITGADLKIIRNEILNSAGDTTRSLSSLVEQPTVGSLSLSREVIQILNNSKVSMIEDDGEQIPVFRATGDFNLLVKIRNEIGAGIVYNKEYTCIGVDDIIGSLMPLLDIVKIAGIKIANGEYLEWRNQVCLMYLDGLEES